MKTTAVIIARFQTPFLHEGHLYLLDEIKSRHNKLIIVLGVAPVKASKRNPFDFYTREKMLKAYNPNLVVLPLADHPHDDIWSTNLDKLVMDTVPGESLLLYGSRDSFIPLYSGQLPVAELPQQGDHSSTHIRTDVADKVLASADFRLGINYACQNMYEKVLPTVDIAVFSTDGTQVLLGRKKTSAGWRFPGGYCDPADANMENAAQRELVEECGQLITTPMQYVGSARVDDWRYRKETDKIITTLFKTTLLEGNPKAADDIEEVAWFGIGELEEMLAGGKIVTEHVVLVQMLLDKK